MIHFSEDTAKDPHQPALISHPPASRPGKSHKMQFLKGAGGQYHHPATQRWGWLLRSLIILLPTSSQLSHLGRPAPLRGWL